MIPALGYAAHDPSSPMAPWRFERRDPGPTDVRIRIEYCGVCHSDLHFVRGEWGPIKYPQVPGHEIVGRVVSVGDRVSKYKQGDAVGVGCLVDSCRTCASCEAGLEQYCDTGHTQTYGGIEKETGRPTQGGYSSEIVVDERFVLRIPDGMDLASAAPLLCAGITTFSPLRQWKVGPGMGVGVVGLGGLGHMAVKLARAMGAEVTLFTTSPEKAADGERLGAHRVVVSRDAAAMKGAQNSLDVILDTVSAPHDLEGLLGTLRRDGTLVLLGGSPSPHSSPSAFSFIMRRKRMAGSLIGGLPETQEMLDFCAKHGIGADIELIPVAGVDEGYARMLRGDVKYRFVLDMSTLPG
ncbi:NAD(P)-dependent alcohol dehydrogenase [Roseisolibacter sp. H3M3-2]|uniref:NAD(P)-dependent alcohol dehydrogenase n=1 Tax=Roseisolibacter sp. H3M3-2 TaxID=3031323 RepID=UPI0023DA0E25|nr:NAD(P)-dependent alcohol dehydrogenase [Roseisolibacter sp. H3M3-2]MDF1504231.1 NAD(P)-dependent alcohol dehydrogenase [Roseisolibacter sp. H3M3-2]